MANETGSSLSSPNEVLFAGNLADDDMTWAVRCPSTEFAELVRRPVEWVAARVDLPGWTLFDTGERAPVPVLAREFCMNVRPAEVPDALGGLVVQGISGTNLLTVLVSPGAFEPLAARIGLSGGDPFGEFWKEIASDPANPPSGRKPLPIVSIPAIGALMAHFEILDRSETPEQQALRTATYVLGVVLDPQGHAAMLSGLDQRWTVVGGGEAPAAPLAFPPTEPRATYANLEGEGPQEDGDEGGGTVCSTVFVPEPNGPPGSGTVTVKRWKANEGS